MKDYDKLKFKAGLEIHQQLNSSKKLFSNAPNFLRSDKEDYTVQRKLHAVPGESGEVDVAVQYEGSLDKIFIYEGYNDTTSLVELDEEPPKKINEEALDICLQIALLLNCEIYPVSQVMRKTVIDGSNTSGFQRTVLIGHDGFVDTSFGTVLIESIALEEDSARVVKREKDKVVYNLDRLGIPLIEITTEPSMKNPEQIKESALKIGEIFRACNVKRGIGTIRQDVNISINKHERVEIKGFQNPKMFVKTIDLEIDRQLRDIENKKFKGEVRKALANGSSEFLRPLPGKFRMYPETDMELLKNGKARLDKLKKNLPKLRSDIKSELRKKGLSEEMINLLVVDVNLLDEFMALIKVYDKDANLVAKMITVWRKEFEKKKNVDDILTERNYEKILEKVRDSKLNKTDVKTVLKKLVEGIKFNNAIKIEKIDENKLEEEIRKIIKDKPGLRENAYMGLVIGKYKGKIDARKAIEIIKKILTNS